ncbi:MAG TPA: zinc-binding dehydrogenase [Terracidiphilus sp.]|nr:zinc-binding dehydrogenase [Terracidiphilus sp.]
MRAAVVRAFDAPPAYATFPDPVPAEGELPVTVTAAGLHPIVKSLANGTHYGSTGELPFIPGVDGVGRLADGTRVFFGIARPPYGTFAERALAANWMCIPIPAGLDDATAAAIANPAMSSWVALTARAQFVPGESVLILGATGVAGQLAVQIAKRLGARRVIASGRNPQALATLQNLGADAVISLDQEQDALVDAFRSEHAAAGMDVVLDYLWGQPAESALKAIAQKGLSKAAPRVRFVQIGSSAGPTISLNAATLRSSGLELIGSGFGSASLDQIKIAIGDFFRAAVAQPFQFNVRTAPLSQVESLWNTPERGSRLVFQP